MFVTWAAGVFSLSLVLTATTSLITQILEIHLHLFAGLLDRCLRCRDTSSTTLKYCTLKSICLLLSETH